MKRTLMVWTACLVLALPISAATIHFESKTWAEGENPQANEVIAMTVRGWVEGPNGRFEIVESGNPMLAQGGVILTQNGGADMVYYRQDNNTCAEWDLQAIVRFAGDAMNAMGGIVKFEVEEPRIDVLVDEPGPVIAGLQTQHKKIRVETSLKMKVLGMKQEQNTLTVRDLYLAKNVGSAALAAWFEPAFLTSGNEDIDQMIEANKPPIEGFVVKSVDKAVVTDKKGRQQTTTTTTEIAKFLRNAARPAGGYAPPADCQEVSMLAGGFPADAGKDTQSADGSDDGGKKKGGFFKRIKKKAGGGG